MRVPNKTFCWIACSLLVCVGNTWLPSHILAQAPANQQPPSARPDRPHDLMQTPRRVSIRQPSQPLHLAEENELTISLQGPAVRQVLVMQRELNENQNSAWIQEAEGAVSVQHRVDGSTYVNVVPQRLGRIEIRFFVTFSDGGYDAQSTTADVVAAKPPETLQVNPNEQGRFPIRMDLSEEWRIKRLYIEATYAGLKRSLPIRPANAQFKVTMAKGEPAIRFDPATGEIDALRIGHALIETSFSGLHQTTCVLVTEYNAYADDRSNCEELHQGAEPEQSREQAAEALFVRNRSTLPYGPRDGRRGRFLADERFEIVTPSHPLHIGQDNAIDLRLRGPAVARIDCHPREGTQQCVAWKGDWSREGMALIQHPDGSASVNLFPMQLGQQVYTFFVLFMDGGVALKKVKVDVDLGTVRPKAIARWCGSKSPDAEMPALLIAPSDGRSNFPDTVTLVPSACYDGILNSVSLPARLVTYNVRNDGGQPVIQLDTATGKATASRPGQALVQQTFAGYTYNACVVVRARDEPADTSNCRDLRARYGTPLPPLTVPVAPSMAIQKVSSKPEPPKSPTIAIPVPRPPIDALTAATLSPNVKDRFNADSRMIISSGGISVPLGEQIRLPLHWTGPEVLLVSVHQKLLRYLQGHAPIEYEGDQGARIEHDADGGFYLPLTPATMGTSEFRVQLLFADGGMATRIVRLPVTLPKNAPLRLINGLEDMRANPANPATTLHLTVQPPTNIRTLFPLVLFKGDGRAFTLRPQDVKFSVENAGGDAVIQLDAATATITARRVGHVLIKTSFAGVETETCVVVMADAVQGDPSNCDEMKARSIP